MNDKAGSMIGNLTFKQAVLEAYSLVGFKEIALEFAEIPEVKVILAFEPKEQE